MQNDDQHSQDMVTFARRWAEAEPTVTGYLRSLTNDHNEINDLLQEVALAATRNAQQYAGQASFSAWCLGIARHKVMDRWRKKSRQRVEIRDPEVLDLLAQEAAALDEETQVRSDALEQCLKGMNEQAWALVRCHYHEQQSYDTIAEQTGTNVNNIRVKLHRIRAKLKQCIERRIALEPRHD